jgi:hypothetical protein
MATTEHETRRTPFLAVALYYGTYLVIFGMIGLGLFIGWPGISAAVQARLAGQPVVLPAAPTAIIAPRPPVSAPAFQPPAAAPAAPAAIPGIAQNAATAQALFDAAVQAAEQAAPLPNTGQSEPATIGEKPADGRQGAGENVPTAKPIQPAESGGIFGSKPVITNIQETHECKHGQSWVEGKGCKNP